MEIINTYILENVEGISDVCLEMVADTAKLNYYDVTWSNYFKKHKNFMLIWGWDADGLYVLAVIAKIYRTVNTWGIKFIHETENPFIQPEQDFLDTRPSLTKEGERKLKEYMNKNIHWFRLKMGFLNLSFLCVPSMGVY